MTFTHFKGSGKIPSKNDKLTLRESGSESSFLKFLRITDDMLFDPTVLFTLRFYYFLKFLWICWVYEQ